MIGPRAEQAPIRRFEDLLVWQKARHLTKEIYTLSAQGPLSRDFGLRDQLPRAAVSIMANIAEGFERGGRGEWRLAECLVGCAEP
jgi:hypothetical protein